MVTQYNFTKLLRDRTQELGDAILYRHLHDSRLEADHPTLSYTALDARARAIGQWLVDQGQQGAPVLLVFSPGLPFIEALFGCFYAGSVAVPVSPPDPTRMQQGLTRLAAIVSDAGASVALTDRLVHTAIQSLPASMTQVDGLTWTPVDSIADDLASGWQDPNLSSEDIALVQYTSGSTGQPKGVTLSHANLIANQHLIQSGFGHEVDTIRGHGGDFGVTWLPLFHDMGLVGHVFQPLFIGATSNFMSPIAFLRRPAYWLEAITRFRPYTTGAPDFGYRLTARKVTDAVFETLDLSSWQVAYSGAEPVRLESLEGFSRRFAPAGFAPKSLYPTYGLAESTLFVTGGEAGTGIHTQEVDAAALSRNEVVVADEDARGVRTLVGCGRPHLETDVQIVDPETCKVQSAGQIGEVWVRGDSVAQGYWKAPEKTEAVFRAHTDTGQGPYLRTGDLGFFHEGQLFVTGRQKDLIILRGRNLYPQDIENAIDGLHPALRPGCCAAFSVEANGEEGLVVLQEARPGGYDPDDLVSDIRRALLRKEGLRAHAVVLLPPKSLLKTSSGKIRRRACRDAFLARTLRPMAEDIESGAEARALVISLEEFRQLPAETRAATLRDSLSAALAQHLGLPLSDVVTDQPLKDTGIDSMSLVDLTLDVDRQLGVEVDFAWLDDGASLDQLAIRLNEAIEAPPMTSN